MEGTLVKGNYFLEVVDHWKVYHEALIGIKNPSRFRDLAKILLEFLESIEDKEEIIILRLDKFKYQEDLLSLRKTIGFLREDGLNVVDNTPIEAKIVCFLSKFSVDISDDVYNIVRKKIKNLIIIDF